MDSTSGLFYVSKLNAYGTEAKDGFCKPINIRIYSAPPPVRMRVITYEMAYWESSTQPNPETQWDEVQRYRSGLTGCKTFSFTTGTLPMDLEGILTEIRRHFHEIVLRGKPCRTRDDAIERLESMNTAEKYFTDERGRYFRVFDVQHVVLVRINEKKAHYIASQRIRYHGEYRDGEDRVITTDDFITAPMTYHDNRELCKRALNHLTNDETITDLLNVSP
jgi:hypothetical protein